MLEINLKKIYFREGKDLNKHNFVCVCSAATETFKWTLIRLQVYTTKDNTAPIYCHNLLGYLDGYFILKHGLISLFVKTSI